MKKKQTHNKSINFWRWLKRNYNLPREEIRELQKEMLSEFMQAGKLPFILKGKNITIFNNSLIKKRNRTKKTS
jgi:hypothetical protein